MDTIEVPVYQQSDQTSIDGALLDLRRMGRGGVVIEADEDCRLLFAGDLLRARHSGIATVQEVPGGEPVVITTEDHSRSYGVDLQFPKRTVQQFEKLLDFLGYRYAMPMPMPLPSGHSAGVPMVVTRSEALGAVLRMTGGYECTGEPKHFFPQPYVTAGQVCPLYPECSRSDGTEPKIIASV